MILFQRKKPPKTFPQEPIFFLQNREKTPQSGNPPISPGTYTVKKKQHTTHLEVTILAAVNPSALASRRDPSRALDLATTPAVWTKESLLTGHPEVVLLAVVDPPPLRRAPRAGPRPHVGAGAPARVQAQTVGVLNLFG